MACLYQSLSQQSIPSLIVSSFIRPHVRLAVLVSTKEHIRSQRHTLLYTHQHSIARYHENLPCHSSGISFACTRTSSSNRHRPSGRWNSNGTRCGRIFDLPRKAKVKYEKPNPQITLNVGGDAVRSVRRLSSSRERPIIRTRLRTDPVRFCRRRQNVERGSIQRLDRDAGSLDSFGPKHESEQCRSSIVESDSKPARQEQRAAGFPSLWSNVFPGGSLARWKQLRLVIACIESRASVATRAGNNRSEQVRDSRTRREHSLKHFQRQVVTCCSSQSRNKPERQPEATTVAVPGV